MSSLLLAAIAFSLSQWLLSVLLMVRRPGWGLRERLFGLLLLAILGYLLLPLVGGGPAALLCATLQTAAPGMFWLFSASVFNDRFQLRAWQLALVAITVLVPLAGELLGVAAGGWRRLFFTAPQALEFLLLGLALWAVARYWRTDLVESRRRLRLWFVGFNGLYLFVLIFSREILFPGAAWLATWEYLSLAALLLAINAVLLDYRGALLFEPKAAGTGAAPVAEATAPEPGDEGLVGKLQAYMLEQAAWREMSLTIGQLAVALEVPQYRLRRAINVGLGYRNFSDFLNSYRIGEAAERLADPAQDSLPVLTIAMDAGFRSLSSFNKAFRDTHDTTPSAWRKAHKK